jgi:enamine deaminase RidA (YjgF/YER057c/UK114 family)/YHS domain-containing protein
MRLTSPQTKSTIFGTTGHENRRAAVVLWERTQMSRNSLFGLKTSATLLGTVLAALFGFSAWGDEPKLSIGGYDSVAYFTDGKPVQGKAEIEYLWHKLRWRFASDAHRELFVKDPEHYAPQYDGYCAMGVTNGDAAHKDTVDPEAWAIVDGKLYLTHNQYWLGIWKEHSEEYIKQANASWLALADRAEPVIVGPPCAASPTTTKVALRDGGHWVVVGGQVARDKDGNVVGKGDMRAQIEQVGKNVDACLSAGGATVKDVIFTVNYVKDPAEFEKYADLRLRYFGPPTPDSATVPVAKLADPDLLVQVETFAKTK